MLFELGSVGYEFFIILKGSVSIQISLGIKGNEENIKNFNLLKDVDFPVKTKPRSKSQFQGVPKSPPNVHSLVLRKTTGYHVMHRDILMKGVNVLREGFSFGEAAIQGKQHVVRNATILCVQDCYFAVLDKTNFQRIIGEHTERETTAKINFLKRVNVFASFHDHEIKTMIYDLQPRKYMYRDRIFSKGDILKKLYIIKSGTVKVMIWLAQVGEADERPECDQFGLQHPTGQRKSE